MLFIHLRYWRVYGGHGHGTWAMPKFLIPIWGIDYGNWAIANFHFNVDSNSWNPLPCTSTNSVD